MAGKKQAKLQYLRMWRSIQKDSALKKAPDYFDLAAKRGINMSHVTSPRERALLRSLSQHQNLHKPGIVVDVSQSVHRACFRTDGLAPALGTGCGRIMATGYGAFLTSAQCLWLQGANPAGIVLDGISEQDRFRMAGNAMSLPVVGAVVTAALSTLKWA
jgi:site-specific DNA-cytosine methylase